MTENRSQLAYSRKDIKNILGVGNTTVQRLLTRAVDPIPHFRIGHKIIVPADLFNRWMAEQPKYDKCD